MFNFNSPRELGINASSSTKLYEYIQSNRWNMANLTVKQSPDEAKIWVETLDKQNKKRRFLPLHAACAKAVPDDLVKSLLDAHIDAVRAEDDYGMLPIHYAQNADYEGRDVVIEALNHAMNNMGMYPANVSSRQLPSRIAKSNLTSQVYTKPKTRLDESQLYTKPKTRLDESQIYTKPKTRLDEFNDLKKKAANVETDLDPGSLHKMISNKMLERDKDYNALKFKNREKEREIETYKSKCDEYRERAEAAEEDVRHMAKFVSMLMKRNTGQQTKIKSFCKGRSIDLNAD